MHEVFYISILLCDEYKEYYICSYTKSPLYTVQTAPGRYLGYVLCVK